VSFDGVGPGDAGVTIDTLLVMDPDLVARWSLDEPPGAISFADRSGFGNTGTCTACPTLGIAGVLGTAIELGNAATGIRIAAGPELLSLVGPLTVAAWVRLSSYDRYGVILSNDRDCCGPYSGFSLWASHYQEGPAMLTWNAGADSLARGPDVIPLATWVHVVGTFDGTVNRVYVDGEQVSASNNASIGAPFSFDLWIGALGYQSPEYHNRGAAIDEVLVFRRALGIDEIRALRMAYL
jgi:large repetitive protein